jgi:hypothetical protein
MSKYSLQICYSALKMTLACALVCAGPLRSHAQGKTIVIDDLTITDFEKSRASQKPESFNITGPRTKLRAVDPDSHAVIQVQSPDISGESSGGKEAAVITFKGPVVFQTEQKDTSSGAVQHVSGRAGRAIYYRKTGTLELLDSVTATATDTVKQPLPCNLSAAAAKLLLSRKSTQIQITGGSMASLVIRQSVNAQNGDNADGVRVTTLRQFRQALISPGQALDVTGTASAPLTLTSVNPQDRRQIVLHAAHIAGKFAADGNGLVELSSRGQVVADATTNDGHKVLESVHATTNGLIYEVPAGKLHLNANPMITVRRAASDARAVPLVYRMYANAADIDLHGDRAQIVTAGAADTNRFSIANLPGGKGNVQVVNYSKLEYGTGDGAPVLFTGPGSRIEYADTNSAQLTSSSDEIRCYFDPVTHELRQVLQRGHVHTRYGFKSSDKYHIPRVVSAEGDFLQTDMYPDAKKQSQFALHLSGFSATIEAPDRLYRPAKLAGKVLDIKQSSEEMLLSVSADPNSALADVPTGLAPEIAKQAGKTVPRRNLKLTAFNKFVFSPGKFVSAAGDAVTVELSEEQPETAATLRAKSIHCALGDVSSEIQAITADGAAQIHATWHKPDNRVETLAANANSVALDLLKERAELSGDTYAAITDSRTLSGKAEIGASHIWINYGGAFASADAVASGAAIQNSFARVPAVVRTQDQKRDKRSPDPEIQLYTVRQFADLHFNAEEGGYAAGPSVTFTAENRTQGSLAEITSPKVSFKLAGQPADLQTADVNGPLKFRFTYAASVNSKHAAPDTVVFGSADQMHLNADMQWAELTGSVNADLNRAGNAEVHAIVSCDRLAITRDVAITAIASGRAEAARLIVLRTTDKAQSETFTLEKFDQLTVGGESTFKAVGAAVKANGSQPRYNRTVALTAPEIDGSAGLQDTDFRLHAALGVQFTFTEQEAGQPHSTPVTVQGGASEILFTSSQNKNLEMIGPLDLTILDEYRLLEPAHVIAPDEQRLTATLSKGVAGLEFTAGRNPVQITMTPRRAASGAGAGTSSPPEKSGKR